MGVDLADLIEKKEIEFPDLKGKLIAIDAYNTIYQFLSIIRQRDGTPLLNSKGEVTSHLSGLLYRTTNLLEMGIKPIFVFDGEPPEFKTSVLHERGKVREKAAILWEEAKAAESEDAFKYAQASSRINDKMIDDAKKLLGVMGIPVVQAPSEGEAQAAFMVKNGSAFAVGSQDFDSMLFGASAMVRNLAISGKRKLPGKDVYVDVKLEMIELEKELRRLELTQEQLIDIALLVGTDYNSGIKMIGPKKAYKLIKKHATVEKVLSEINENIPDLPEIKNLFMNPKVTGNYEIEFKHPDERAIKEFLCNVHDFSEDRVANAVNRLKEASSRLRQRTLEQWFS